jgi:hypothetical protein
MVSKLGKGNDEALKGAVSSLKSPILPQEY